MKEKDAETALTEEDDLGISMKIDFDKGKMECGFGELKRLLQCKINRTLKATYKSSKCTDRHRSYNL
jgi:hypothetical protein